LTIEISSLNDKVENVKKEFENKLLSNILSLQENIKKIINEIDAKIENSSSKSKTESLAIIENLKKELEKKVILLS